MPDHDYTPPPDPPPPLPAPASEVFADGQGAGLGRCYFCGQLIHQEAEMRKTQYEVGHGHKIFALICPTCSVKKVSGEGPFEKKRKNSAGLFNAFLSFGAMAVAVVIIHTAGDAQFEQSKRENDKWFRNESQKMDREHEEWKKKHGFGNQP
jgi:hypothetical protein